MTQDKKAQIEASARKYIEDVMSLQGGSDGVAPETVERAIRQVAKASKRHTDVATRYQKVQAKRQQF